VDHFWAARPDESGAQKPGFQQRHLHVRNAGAYEVGAN
jgi:hypothetical protein